MDIIHALLGIYTDELQFLWLITVCALGYIATVTALIVL
jgi:hypothetical protein